MYVLQEGKGFVAQPFNRIPRYLLMKFKQLIVKAVVESVHN